MRLTGSYCTDVSLISALDGVGDQRHTPAALPLEKTGRVQLKCDGTQWRTGGEVKVKLAHGVGSQYSSHYLRTWCIQHYYR